MRAYLKCQQTDGLQACIELGILVDCIVSNGIVFTYTEPGVLEKWQERYAWLKEYRSKRWKDWQWQQRGFKIVRQKLPGLKQPKRIPKLIVSKLTI